MFNLGATCHLIHDFTVPQHANVRLLNTYRSYENWVIKAHIHHHEFKLEEGEICLNSLNQFIHFNINEVICVF